MKHIIIIISFLFVTSHSTFALSEGLVPEIDPGPGGGGSVQTLEKILDILFSNKKKVYPTVPIPSPTPDPLVPTPTWPPGTTPTPTIPLPTRNPNNSILNLNYNYPQQYVDNARPCLANSNVYKEVETTTGVMWEIVAGIHLIEGSCGSQKSCVSGRAIGANEPDLHGNCTQADTGIGKPNPLPGGGCGFTNLLDSCVYGANHLIGKIGKTPTTLEDFAKALGRYNGTGNANCGKTPFVGCPPPYEGYDHIYPMSKYDDAHQTMYLVYCADGVKCNPPQIFQRIGVLTAASIVHKL